MVTGAEKAAVPRPKRGPLTPPRPSVGPVLGTGGSALTWAWVLSSDGTDPGPKAQRHQGHQYRIPFLPSPGNGSFVTSGQGPGSEDKVHAGAFDLAQWLRVSQQASENSTVGSTGVDLGLRARHSRAHVQDPSIPAQCSHSSQTGACPLVLGTPACTGTHRCPTLPYTPIYLPT